MKLFITISSALLLLAAPAVAQPPDVAAAPPLVPQVQNGVRFLTGGIGDREQKELRELDDDYNVRVAMTREDGAYLADVDVVLENRSGKALLETTTRGPILLAELAPGRYVMRASSEGRTTERRVIDVPREHDQIRLYVALEDASQQAAKK